MLKQFNSNIKSNKFVRQIVNSKNLVNGDLTGSLLNIPIPSKITFNSTTKKHIKSINKIFNVSGIENVELTASLQNIELPTNNKFNSNTKSNPYSIKTVNNKNTILDFHQEILEHSAMWIKVRIDEFDNIANTLTIHNIHTDYATEGASADNFEVLVFGLNIPGDYTIKDTPVGVVVTLNDRYIDFDNVTLDDIYVIGKLRYLNLDTEDSIDLLTEDGDEIIV